jgi:hypothetical protein
MLSTGTMKKEREAKLFRGNRPPPVKKLSRAIDLSMPKIAIARREKVVKGDRPFDTKKSDRPSPEKKL